MKAIAVHPGKPGSLHLAANGIGGFVSSSIAGSFQRSCCAWPTVRPQRRRTAGWTLSFPDGDVGQEESDE